MNTGMQPTQNTPPRVVVSGPDGHMGKAVVAGLVKDPTVEVVGEIRRGDSDVAEKLKSADVLIDFTHAEASRGLMLAAIEAGVRPVSGTSGIPEDDLNAVDEAARQRGIAAVWAATFGLGPLVLSLLARLAARHLGAVEIIEGHPARKADSPSGTAMAMARAIRKERGVDFEDPPVKNALLEGIRGAAVGGVRLHSVRHPAPTMIAWHEVLFTSDDGLLTLRFADAADADATPSIVRTVHEVMTTERVGLIRGYDSVIGLELPPA